MEVNEILKSKEKLVEFLKEKGIEKVEGYQDEEYPEADFFKIDGKIMAICKTDNKENIRDMKSHFLKDRGFSYFTVFVRGNEEASRIIFFRNFGERKYFLYSHSPYFHQETIKGKEEKLNNIGVSINALFQTKDISKAFYEKFKVKRDYLASKISGEMEATEKYLIAQRIFDRVFFTYFICNKGIIQKNGGSVPGKALFQILRENGDFFENMNDLFSMFNDERENKLKIGDYEITVPYLNGGLFRISEKEKDIVVDMSVEEWKNIFDFLDSYNWIIEDSLSEQNDEKTLTPEILGHVYERSVVEWEKGFEEEAEKAVTRKSERKGKGVYYTPVEITQYISENTIIPYVLEKLDGDYDSLEYLLESENKDDLEMALKILREMTILDPACGSGAFLIQAVDLIYLMKRAIMYALRREINSYQLKMETIVENIYGVDILKGAVEISKLRLWLWLISDFKGEGLRPLPNIDYNLRVGDSLVGYFNSNKIILSTKKDKVIWKTLVDRYKSIYSWVEEENSVISLFKKRQKLIEDYKNAHGEEAEKLKEEIEKRTKKYDSIIDVHFIKDFDISPVNNIFHWIMEFSEIFEKGGFDIILGNPPYVSNKGREKAMKSAYKKIYGISDDLYNYFITRSFLLLKKGGVVSLITSNTYLTIQSKINIRALLQEKRLIEIFKSGDPFEAAVDTAIFIAKNEDAKDIDYEITFKDVRGKFKENFESPDTYKANISIFRNALNKVFFVPTPLNMQIYEKYNDILKDLYKKWWDKIKDSKRISKNERELEIYRKSLKEGDITLLGLISDGGVGLQTGDNGRFVGVREGTKQAQRTRETRPEKLFTFIKNRKPTELNHLNSEEGVKDYLDSISEYEIREVFDQLKEKYGKDIFGQGYLYKIILPEEIADVDSLTKEEKLNGIDSSKAHWVPYDKGDKDGNKWYAESPFVIDWSKESVNWFKNSEKARWQGYKFFFKEGFCWTNVLNPNARMIKCRFKEKTVNDVGSMSLHFTILSISTKFFVSLLNSSLLFDYYRNFINQSVNVQINDIRLLPIIIPTNTQLRDFEDIFNRAYTIKKRQFAGEISKEEAERELAEIQKELDEKVYKLYGISTT